MTAAMATAMQRADLGTHWLRPTSRARVMPFGEHPGLHIASLTEPRKFGFCDVALVGGQLYLDVMRHFADLFRKGAMSTVPGSQRSVDSSASSGATCAAKRSWQQNKAPMAVYWKAVSVYATPIGLRG
jgi:hypothetical protein